MPAGALLLVVLRTACGQADDDTQDVGFTHYSGPPEQKAPPRKFQSEEGQGNCETCAAGFYQAQIAQETCIDCPAGQYGPYIGAPKARRCFRCPPGKFQAKKANIVCSTCSPGKHQRFFAGKSCDICDKGHVSSPSFTECVICPSGMYQSASTGYKCVACPPGEYHPPAAGGFSDFPPGCLKCPIGKYQRTDATVLTCISCPSGKFQNVRASTYCKICPGDHWTKGESGKASCECQSVDCVVGNWGDFSACSRSCGTGTQTRFRKVKQWPNSCGLLCPTLADLATCSLQNCPVDCELRDWGPDSVCTKTCGGGKSYRKRKVRKMAAYGGRACGTLQTSLPCNTQPCPCPAGRFAQVKFLGRMECLACPSGKYKASNGTQACRKCPGCDAGAFRSGCTATSAGSCVSCPAGKYKLYDDGSTCAACKSCPAGKWRSKCALEDDGKCTKCLRGFFKSKSATWHTSCAACAACPPGKFRTECGGEIGPGTCESCAKGKYKNDAGAWDSECSLCERGAYQPSTGMRGCALCPLGQYGDGGVSCKPCAPNCGSKCATGQYLSHSKLCVSCPTGKFQSASGFDFCYACQTCGSGAMRTGCTGTSSGQCVACPVGTYKKQTTVTWNAVCTECQACPSGKYRHGCGSGHAGECVACESGKFKSTGEEGYWSTKCVECATCDAGLERTNCGGKVGPGWCDPCSTGKYKASEGVWASPCLECDLGMFQELKSGKQCNVCPKGQFQKTKGQDRCSRCPRGYYGASGSTKGCTKCASGQYQENLGQTSCVACAPGSRGSSHVAPVSESYCTVCESGKYTDLPGQSKCFNCADYTSTCVYCEWTEGKSGAKSCTDKPVDCKVSGWELWGPCSATCVGGPMGGTKRRSRIIVRVPEHGGKACPSLVESKECATVQCPSDCKVSAWSAWTKCSQPCTGPSQGYPSQTATRQVTAQPKFGGKQCPATTTTQRCNRHCCKGYYYTQGGCLACAAGSMQPFSLAHTYPESCVLCAAGMFQQYRAQSECTACGAGQYSSFGAAACTGCKAGTFQDATDGALCKTCPLGKYQPSHASVSCSECPSGMFGFPGGDRAASEHCVACPNGYYRVSVEQASCQTCGLSLGVTGGPKSCLQCPKGYLQMQTNQNCQPCGAGSNGPQTCEVCPSGYFKEDTVGECTTCPMGQWTRNAAGAKWCEWQPIPCLVSTWTPWSACSKSCGGGTHGRKRRVLQEHLFGGQPCPTLQQDDVCNRLPCPFDCHVSQWSTWSDCTASCNGGTQSRTRKITMPPSYGGRVCPKLAGTKRCNTHCCEGNYKFAAKAGCTTCPRGKFRPTMGAASLEDRCLPCPKGKFTSAESSLTCTICGPGMYGHMAEGSDSPQHCRMCPMGKYQKEGASLACNLCPGGTYAPKNGSKSIDDCYNCLPGMFQAGEGSSSCVNCPKGKFSSKWGAVYCLECALGKFGASVGTDTAEVCKKCSAGFFSPLPASHKCTVCVAGRYQAQDGASSCLICDRGMFSAKLGANDAKDCQACPTGKFQVKGGSAYCDWCPEGYSQPLRARFNASSCRACGVGQYGVRQSAASCVRCTHGRYGSSTAQTSPAACSLAPAGYYAGAGAGAARECPMGKYQDATGQGSCVACGVGRFMGAAGIGAAGPATNSSSCAECPAGKFQALRHQTNCLKCEGGQYQELTGQNECRSCWKGRFRGLPGADSRRLCKECPAGKYSEHDGTSACTECAATKYGISAARTREDAACFFCPSGKFSSNMASLSCYTCGEQHVWVTSWSHDSVVHCLRCPAGKFQKRDGSTVCAICEAGQFVFVQNAKVFCKPCADTKEGQFWTENTAGWSNCVPKPTNCVAGQWSSYTPCSKSCRPAGMPPGTRSRTRQVVKEAWGGGQACKDYEIGDGVAWEQNPVGVLSVEPGHWRDTEICNAERCASDCLVSEWEPWTSCSVLCGTGITKRTRAVLAPSSHGGRACPHLFEEVKCNDFPCSIVPLCPKRVAQCSVEKRLLPSAMHSCPDLRSPSCYECSSKQDCEDKGITYSVVVHHPRADGKGDKGGNKGGNKHFHCKSVFDKKTGKHACECRCEHFTGCCSRKGYGLDPVVNLEITGSRYHGVHSADTCCQMCSSHPECGSWEFFSDGVCSLKTLPPTYIAVTGSAVHIQSGPSTRLKMTCTGEQ